MQTPNVSLASHRAAIVPDKAPQSLRGQVGQIGSHRVRIGPGAKIPASSTSASQALKSFFQSAGKKIGAAFDSLQLSSAMFGAAAQNVQESLAVAPAERSPAEVRAALSQSLPPGVTVSESGEISGSVEATAYPEGNKLTASGAAMTFEQTILASFDRQMQEAKFQEFDGVRIGSQAASDFFRMDLTFESEGKQFNARDIPDKTQSVRNGKVAAAMTEFTGDATSTLVLSTFVTQNLSRLSTDACTDKSGAAVAYNPVSSGQGPQKFRGADGTLTDEIPKSIGGMKITLSKTASGDIRIQGSWPYLVSGSSKGVDKTPFEGMDGAVLKVQANFDMTVSAEAARNGKLEFLVPPKVTLEFHGQMAPAYCAA